MSSRPRCGDWTPLITQQLRLRNLIQVSGHNIACSVPKASVYYTLHLTDLSTTPVYTSQQSATPSNAVWPEIQAQTFQHSNATHIYVRVWQHALPRRPSTPKGRSQRPSEPTVSTAPESLPTKRDSSKDRQLFVWHVYFSGLMPISKRTDVRLRPNSLIFHIRGGFFTSFTYLQPCSVPEQLAFMTGQKRPMLVEAVEAFQTGDAIHSRNASGGIVTITVRRIADGSGDWDGDCSDEDSDAASAAGGSPKTSANNDSNGTDDASATASAATTASDTATSDGQPPIVEPDPNTLKLRYIERRFYATECRRSYSVEKLQLLQYKQRQLQKITAATKTLREEICRRSANCVERPAEVADADVLATMTENRSRCRSDSSVPPARLPPTTAASTPLTLNRLLNQQPARPSPALLWHAQEARRHLEIARSRIELLLHQRSESIRRTAVLQRELQLQTDDNRSQKTWLAQQYDELRDERRRASESVESVRDQGIRLRRMREAIRQIQHQLLHELAEVFDVDLKRPTTTTTTGAHADGGGAVEPVFTINGAALPNSESFTEQTVPSEMSVALGWAAHLTVMCARILDVPLRNEVLLKGSASRIRDDVTELSDAERE